MFGFGYNLTKAPFLTYRVVSQAGAMRPPVPVTLPDPVMMHDFAVTERYAVFMDMPLVFKPEAIAKGMPFVWEGGRAARFGILPRYASSEAEMQWFELPALFIFHVANAWEEEAAGGGGTEVVLVACKFPFISLEVPEDMDSSKALQRL